MRTCYLCLTAAAVLLLASSTASADWTYVGSVQLTTSSPVVYPAPTVTTIYPYPVYTYTYPYPVPTVYRSSVVIGPRVIVPRRTWRRTVWTVW